MKAPSDYLTAAKVEEIETQLREDGYDVTVNPDGPDAGYDLVASRGDRRLAISVKAQSDLQAAVDQIRRLRQRSHEQGYHEFRLVVVNPPRSVQVEVEGLEEILYDYLSEHFPDELDSLSSGTRLDGVSEVEIDVLEVAQEGTHVAGTGSVEVELSWGGGNRRDGFEAKDTFPLHFDIWLDGQLGVREVNSLKVDTSSFTE